MVSKLRSAIPQQYPGARVDAGESVSGKVSEELAQNSALAVVLAMIGIAVYIWFRFEWQFGVGALLTLAHDVSMTLGFFAFTRLPVDLNVVAAFLTILGYSLNDTVVIYDRIREDLRKYRRMAILPLINLSLNETLARTVVTSLTVLIALGVLMAIGPASHLRPRHRHLPWRDDRHLFIDLHFCARARLARSEARQLPEARRERSGTARDRLTFRSAETKLLKANAMLGLLRCRR